MTNSKIRHQVAFISCGIAEMRRASVSLPAPPWGKLDIDLERSATRPRLPPIRVRGWEDNSDPALKHDDKPAANMKWRG